MQKKLRFEVYELEGDTFIQFYYGETPASLLKMKDLELVEYIFMNLEIYEVVDGLYQAPPGRYTIKELTDMLSKYIEGGEI